MRLEWANFGLKGANFKPERLDGGTIKLTNEQTEEQIQDFVPFRAAAQKTKKMLLMLLGQNLPKSWPHKVIMARFWA